MTDGQELWVLADTPAEETRALHRLIEELRQDLAQQKLVVTYLLEVVKAHRLAIRQLCDKMEVAGVALPPVETAHTGWTTEQQGLQVTFEEGT